MLTPPSENVLFLLYLLKTCGKSKLVGDCKQGAKCAVSFWLHLSWQAAPLWSRMKTCPENGSNMGPLKFWANPVMIMMLELQHFASVVLLLHAEITAHASVSFLFLAALLLFTSRGTKHSVRGVVCTELAAHRFPVEESSRF